MPNVSKVHSNLHFEWNHTVSPFPILNIPLLLLLLLLLLSDRLLLLFLLFLLFLLLFLLLLLFYPFSSLFLLLLAPPLFSFSSPPLPASPLSLGCRRLHSWCRKRKGSVIDQQLWQEMQRLFPKQCEVMHRL